MRARDVCLLVTCIQMSCSVFSSGLPEYCEQARNHCLTRIGCQMAFNNFLIGCNDIMYGRISTCTTDCKNALISLLSTENGAGFAFVNCNCSGDEYCQTRKRRVEICSIEVMSFMNARDDNAVVSCGLARWMCEADTSCLAALRYYIHHCVKLVDGKICSQKCNNSLDILYRQTSSKRLQTCVCDGTEDYDCQALKDNTEKLCFNRQPKAVYTHVYPGNNSGGIIQPSSGRAARKKGRRTLARKGKSKNKAGGRKSTPVWIRHLKRLRKREKRRRRRGEMRKRRAGRRSVRVEKAVKGLLEFRDKNPMGISK